MGGSYLFPATAGNEIVEGFGKRHFVFPLGSRIPFRSLRQNGFRQHGKQSTLLFRRSPGILQKTLPESRRQPRANIRKLITAFDVHKTLQHLLHPQTRGKEGWKNTATEEAEEMSQERDWSSEEEWKDSDGGDAKNDRQREERGPRKKSQEAFSLFTDEIPNDRSCERAGIPDAFCSCYRRQEMDVGSPTSVALATELVATINEALVGVSDVCVRWDLRRVVKVKKIEGKELYVVQVKATSERESGREQSEEGGKTNLNGEWKVRVEEQEEEGIADQTVQDPHGTFEGWIKLVNGDGDEGVGTDGFRFEVNQETISRLDRYGKSSQCVVERKPSIKHLCFCKSLLGNEEVDFDKEKRNEYS